jgi:hypothetical protein
VVVEQKGRHFAMQLAFEERKWVLADDVAGRKGPAHAAIVVEQKGQHFAEQPADAAVVVEQKGQHFAEQPAEELAGQRDQEQPVAGIFRIGAVGAVAGVAADVLQKCWLLSTKLLLLSKLPILVLLHRLSK